MAHLHNLDRGQPLIVDGREKFVVAFPICFVGNIVMQQKLSGCLSHQTTYPCRICLVHTDQRHDVSYNIKVFGRYYYYMRQQRAKANATWPATRCRMLAGIGIDPDDMLYNKLTTLFPALDPYISFPVNTPHSEIAGITHRLITMLMARILVPKATKELHQRLQRFKFPPGWARLQSPLRHLDSWGMQEHGRAAIIFPIFLNQWLFGQPESSYATG